MSSIMSVSKKLARRPNRVMVPDQPRSSPPSRTTRSRIAAAKTNSRPTHSRVHDRSVAHRRTGTPNRPDHPNNPHNPVTNASGEETFINTQARLAITPKRNACCPPTTKPSRLGHSENGNNAVPGTNKPCNKKSIIKKNRNRHRGAKHSRNETPASHGNNPTTSNANHHSTIPMEPCEISIIISKKATSRLLGSHNPIKDDLERLNMDSVDVSSNYMRWSVGRFGGRASRVLL